MGRRRTPIRADTRTWNANGSGGGVKRFFFRVDVSCGWGFGGISAVTEHELHGVDDIPGLDDVVLDDRHLRCTVEPEHLGELLSHLSAAGIRTLESQPPTLEQLFLSQYAAGERDG